MWNKHHGTAMTEANKKMIIFSAPSGCGKTSLARALIASRDDVALAVSHTTRAMREGEVDGVDYHFIDKKRFESMIADNAFLEHAQVFDHLYGTSLSSVEALNQQGKHVILDIDWQGARQVRENKSDVESVFILPPSVGVLQDRLVARGQDAEEVIERRMRDAVNEMSHQDEYTHLVINDDFETALAELGDLLGS